MGREKKITKLLGRLKRVIKPAGALLGLVVIIIWTTGILKDRIVPETLPHAPGFALPDDAEIHIAGIKPVSRLIDVTGTVASEEMVSISARINAHVNSVHAAAGSIVTAGQMLVSLDDREIQEQLSASDATLEHAETEFNRTKRLYESDSATHRDFMAAQSEYRKARARNNEIKVMLSFTQITSPIDGVVAERYIEAGDLAIAGNLLMSVYDPSIMRLEAPVPVRLMGRLSLGGEIPVQLEYQDVMHKGEVTEIVSEVDAATRTRIVRIQLPSEINDILPGTFGRIWIESSPEDGIFVPESTVYTVGQLEMVQAVTDRRVTRRLVTTGQTHNGHVEILSGLIHGDAILLHPIPAPSARPGPASATLNPGGV